MNSTAFNSVYVQSTCGWGPIGYRLERHDVRYLDLVTFPFLLLLATVGNVFTILILGQEKPIVSKNVYLVGIAVSDLVYMWAALFSYTSNYDGEIYGRPRPAVRTFLFTASGVGYFLQECATIVSSWLIVAFSAERFMAIKYPFRHMVSDYLRRCGPRIAAAVFVAVLLSSHRLVDYYWFFCNYSGTGPPPQRPQYLLTWNKVYTSGLAVVHIITFLVIFVLNAILLRIILEKQQYQQKELQADAEDSRITTRPDANALMMLGACVVLYLVTQTPVLIYNVLHLLEKSCVSQMSAAQKQIFIPLANVLLNINYSANFLAYCGADRTFRQRVCSNCSFAQKTRFLEEQAELIARRQSRTSDKSNIPLSSDI